MGNSPLKILLADDDEDDCLLFKEALAELEAPAVLTFVHDGVHLMDLLIKNNEKLPDVLFLDLNMPRKSGFDCLMELKRNERLWSLPVAIFSTAQITEQVNWLYDKGADFYICKPAEFVKLKNALHQVLTILAQHNFHPRLRDNFVITAQSESIEA
jgi:CheY-like chemotaxis protein